MQLDFAAIAVNAAIVGSVQAVIGLVMYKLIERQDQKIDRLSGRVRELEDQKIARIEERLKDGSAEFDDLHQENKSVVHDRQFQLHREECATRFVGMEMSVKSLLVTSTETQALVKLICANLHISFPSAPGQKG